MDTQQSTTAYLWKYTNIHNVKSLSSKEDAREYVTSLAVMWNITEIKDSDYFLNNLTQAIENNEQQVACDHLFTNKSDKTTHYILIFIHTISPNHIEVGLSYQKTNELGTHSNELELFSKTLIAYRTNALKNLQLHIQIIRNFHDGSLSDKTPLSSNQLGNIRHTMVAAKEYYPVWLGLGLCLTTAIVYYLRRQSVANVLNPPSESIDKRRTYLSNAKEIPTDSGKYDCQATPSSCSEGENKIC